MTTSTTQKRWYSARASPPPPRQPTMTMKWIPVCRHSQLRACPTSMYSAQSNMMHRLQPRTKASRRRKCQLQRRPRVLALPSKSRSNQMQPPTLLTAQPRSCLTPPRRLPHNHQAHDRGLGRGLARMLRSVIHRLPRRRLPRHDKPPLQMLPQINMRQRAKAQGKQQSPRRAQEYQHLIQRLSVEEGRQTTWETRVKEPW